MEGRGGREEEGKAIFFGGDMGGLAEEKKGELVRGTEVVGEEGDEGRVSIGVGAEGVGVIVVVTVVLVVIVVVVVGGVFGVRVTDATLPEKAGRDFPRTRRDEKAEGGQDCENK